MMGDRHRGQSPGPHGGTAASPAGGRGAVRGWFLPAALGSVGMALGVKWPELVTHEGDARVSVKTCYWDFFFGGMRLVTWDVSTFAYVPVDKGRVYRCVENTRWVHGSMPRLNDSWRLINRHSQRWSAQLHPNMGVGTLHHSPAASSSSGYSGPGVSY